ncbi:MULTISPECIES: TetR/AcrR family transcriptional regulator [Amycolatopsis]|uniref:TetR/AcrR family transcriptional regulator n=1 Tax=Amycolatopsis eburnea TaxID=2267691 RepID=A0A3R9E212_9PSEU|nr:MULTISPECIES: TetR/AcrR family transcriptional regulator [Amycolatopsis]NBH01777.1 TetR family transcriptional regulator [Amycolatopsis sp. SID8362]NED38478.1 TetR/AcrR family transcriptional regulator [Amycolatopsis sp. SID8362]RSD23813.1 TetR/AcrR family transcriptional regulator [Amycolatopsis eburnea]
MRTRLSTQERREQLLTIGAGLFASRPYDEVWIEEVAEIAQVSRGLLYHYFPTKKEFFLEIVRSQRDQLLEMSEPDPALPVAEQLRAGLDVYLEFARTHPDGYRVVHRAAAGADREVLRIREAGMAANAERILTALGALTTVTETTRVAVRGWLAFVATVILDWLDQPKITQAELRDLCVRTLFSAVDVTP